MTNDYSFEGRHALTTSAPRAVADALKAEILAGRLPPGTRLRQMDIAKKFSVSTTPIREAFALLRTEGLVQINSQRGATVFAPSQQEILHMYEMRVILEALAIEKAAIEMKPADIARIGQILLQLKASNNRSEYLQLNEQFHTEIYRCSNRPKLVELIASLRASCDLYLQMAMSSLEFPSQSVASEHDEIFNALRARVPERASEALKEHLWTTYEVTTSLMRSREQLSEKERHE